jgi:DmsE family decaheme c-type cytochrome
MQSSSHGRSSRKRYLLLSIAALILSAAGVISLRIAEAQLPAGRDVVEVCKGCHADYVQSYLAHRHGQAGNVRGPDCQTCHGNAEAHVKAGGGRGVGGVLGFSNKTISADRKAGVCLSCHEGNRHLAFWDAGKHRKNDVSCNNCHTLHGTPGKGSTIALVAPDPLVAPYETTVRQLQYETCTSCHRQIRSQLLRPSHHPIVEGRITCTDCHNPHGALSHAMVKSESVVQLCTSCHAEKRGPFIWGHPPVEENCLTCHNSHGSNHARLLAEKAPNVCQDCHDAAKHPGTVYGGGGGWNTIPPGGTPNTRLIARGCVNCHFHIHGSNAPANRGKYFLR